MPARLHASTTIRRPTEALLRLGASLRLRLLTLFLVVALLPLFGSLYATRQDVLLAERRMQEEARMAAYAAAQPLRHSLGHVTRMAQSLGSLAAFRESDAAERDRILAALIAPDPLIETVSYFTADFVERGFSHAGAGERSDYALHPWARETVASGRLSLAQERTPGLASGAPTILLALPVHPADQHGPAGFLAAALRIDALPALWEDVPLPPGSDVVLVDQRNGRALAHSGAQQQLELISASLPAALLTATQPVYASDPDGVEHMLVWETLPDTPLAVVLLMPTANVFASAYAAELTHLGISVTLAVASLVILTLLWQQIAGQLHRFQQGAIRWGQGDYSYRIDLQSRDELGRLGAVFDAMAAQLQQTVHQLETDLTERRRTEAALQRSEERFRRLFEDAPIGMATADLDHGLIAFNRAFCRMTGYTPEELAHLSVQDITHPADFAREVVLVEQLRAGEIPVYQIEKRYITSSGATIWVKLTGTAVRDREGTIRTGLAMVEDITEQRRAAEALRTSAAHLRLITDNLPVVLAALDANGVYTFSEGKMLERLGLKPGELAGRSVFETFAALPDDLDYYRRALQGEAVTWTSVLSVYTYVAHLAPLHNEAGQVQGLIGLALDITERKRADEERLRLERKLLEAQKLESLGVLAGGIAHDFNNLLTVILGNADLALVDIPPSSPAYPLVQTILHTAQRAAELTRQLLDYSGKGRLIAEPLDLNDLIRDMTALLQTSIAKGVDLNLKLAPNLPAMVADAAQIRQVVMNLVINASEAINRTKGTITITTCVTPWRPAEFTSAYLAPERPVQDYIAMEVADTGCGMDDETRERIFDPFFTTKFTGRGLGLAAVLGIVRGHHGALKVESSPGAGTTFTVLFPPTATPAPMVVEPESPDATPATGTILVIDDDESVRIVAVRMLERMGFQVLSAGTGEVGVELFHTYAATINGVLLDLTMPAMSGEQVARALHAIRPEMPIVLMSGYSEDLAAQRFSDLKLAGFLQKPFRPADLQAAMQRVAEARLVMG